jgi:hypothetical protein
MNVATLFENLSWLLSQVPGTFWGVIAGSIFTLLGTQLTNRANDKRLRLQLQTDRELQSREREMTFRKEVFASAAEAVARAVNTPSKFSDLSVSQKDLSAAILESSPVLAKVNLVANEDTVRALAALGSEMAGAFMHHLSHQRLALEALQENIKIKTDQMGGFAKARDAMLELMRHQNIEGRKDDRRFQTIEKNFNFESERVNATIREIQSLENERRLKHVAFAKDCLIQNARVSSLFPPVLIAARKELEVSVSLDSYAEILNETRRKAEAHANEYLGQIASFNQTTPDDPPEAVSQKG